MGELCFQNVEECNCWIGVLCAAYLKASADGLAALGHSLEPVFIALIFPLFV
jgi:hypothetical protein